MTTFAASIPPVSKEFFDTLVEAFPPLTPQPNVTTMDEIMFNAGQQELIEWIRVKAIRSSTLTGSADVATSINVRQT